MTDKAKCESRIWSILVAGSSDDVLASSRLREVLRTAEKCQQQHPQLKRLKEQHEKHVESCIPGGMAILNDFSKQDSHTVALRESLATDVLYHYRTYTPRVCLDCLGFWHRAQYYLTEYPQQIFQGTGLVGGLVGFFIGRKKLPRWFKRSKAEVTQTKHK